jgi:hypothetical protein
MSSEEIESRITGHYGWSGLMERIQKELRQHGINPQQVTVDQLAPVDNHSVHAFANRVRKVICDEVGLSRPR